MHELHWRLTQACPPGQSAFWLHCPTTHTPFAQTFPAPHEEDVTQASHEPPAHTLPALQSAHWNPAQPRPAQSPVVQHEPARHWLLQQTSPAPHWLLLKQIPHA